MIQKYKFVEKNIDMLRTLTKDGYISHNLLFYYQIYKSYMDCRGKFKMGRYEIIAMENKVSISTVRKAVREMKAYVKG